MMSNLPDWPGADSVYRRVQAINIARCNASYERHNSKRGKWCIPEDVADCIDAMNGGDEEYLKAYIAMNRDWL